MADFKTHVVGAAAVSGIAATSLMLAGVASEQAVLGYFVLGIVGGLLPDIDSDTSIPIRIAFNVLAVFSGFLTVFALGRRYSLSELLLLWLACFVTIRYGAFNVFTRCTVHRGLIHSIPAAMLSGLLTTWLVYHVLNVSALHAWICGSFVFLGFVIHLLLDELYSVDLLGMQLRRSFGSAFNLGRLQNPLGTAALYLAVVALLYLSPPAQTFLERMLDGNAYHQLAQRVLPARGWFDGVASYLSSR